MAAHPQFTLGHLRDMRAIVIIWLLVSLGFSATYAAESNSDEAFARIDRMHRELNGTCKYAILDKNKQNKELMCVLDLLRSRCNKIDDCYVYCHGNDVGVDIGGGCDHLCNYGSRAKWEPPKGIEACQRK